MRPFVLALALSSCAVAACNTTSDAGFPDRIGGAGGGPASSGNAAGSGIGGSTAAASGGEAGNSGSPNGRGGAHSAAGGLPTVTGGATGTGGSVTGGQPGTGGSSVTASGGGSGIAGGAAGAPNSGEGGHGGDAGSAGAPPGSPPALAAFRVAVIGSSTSAGEGASSASRGWVALLDDALDDRVSTEFSLNNLSVGGYSSDDLIPGSRSNGSIDDAIERNPNLIVVALAGSNDLSSGTSRSTFLSRLESMREAGETAGIPVFFLTTAPKDLSNDEQQALEQWAGAIRDEFDTCWTPFAARHSPCVIDVFEPLANSSLGVRSEFSAGDGIHLNDAGHAEIFRLALSVIEPYVCALTACSGAFSSRSNR